MFIAKNNRFNIFINNSKINNKKYSSKFYINAEGKVHKEERRLIKQMYLIMF